MTYKSTNKKEVINVRRCKQVFRLIFCSLLILGTVIHANAGEISSGDGIYDEIKAVIPVEVEKSGEVTITPVTKKAPAPDYSSLEVNEGDKVAFTVEYNEPGKFEYEIKQIPGKDSTVKYDTTIYRAEVWFVAEDDGTLDTSVVIFKRGSTEKTGSARFVNTYPEETKVTPQVTPEPGKQSGQPGQATGTVVPSGGSAGVSAGGSAGVSAGASAGGYSATGPKGPSTGDDITAIILGMGMLMAALVLFATGKKILRRN